MLTAPTTEEICSICLEPLDSHATGNNSKATLACGHAFHSCCIIKVARSDTHCHGMCPLCRATPDGHTEPADAEPLDDEPLLSSRTVAYLERLPSSAWTSAFRMPADYETDDVLLSRAMNLARTAKAARRSAVWCASSRSIAPRSTTRFPLCTSSEAIRSGCRSFLMRCRSLNARDARRRRSGRPSRGGRLHATHRGRPARR